jgi:tRNA (adenine37-N6)-methyltransferase
MKPVRSQKPATRTAISSRRDEAVQPKNATFTVRPIGVVRSSIKQVADDCWGGLTSVIEIDPLQFKPESTTGLEQFSHLEIVFLLDRIAPESVHTGSRHPRGRSDWPITGIFAQRAKDRPNRIGITVCKIESVDGLRISVRELDAIEGTPVLDIKPYIQQFGPREPVRQPPWANELMASYFKPGK